MDSENGSKNKKTQLVLEGRESILSCGRNRFAGVLLLTGQVIGRVVVVFLEDDATVTHRVETTSLLLAYRFCTLPEHTQ